LGNDVQDFQNGNAAADERGERAGEAGQADLVRDGAEDGQFNAAAIPEFTALRGFDEPEPAVNNPATAQDEQQDVVLHEIAEVDQELGGRGQLAAETRIHVREHRHHLDQQEGGDEHGHHADDGRIHEGGFDLFAESRGVFQVGRQARKNFGQQTALFTGGNHGDIQAAEGFGVLLQSFGETVTAFHARANVLDDVAHDLVGGLFGERLEALHHRETGINHGGELAGKDDEVGKADFAAGGSALFADLFLDGNDEEVAVEQGGDGGLFGAGLDRAADFAAGGRFPCHI